MHYPRLYTGLCVAELRHRVVTDVARGPDGGGPVLLHLPGHQVGLPLGLHGDQVHAPGPAPRPCLTPVQHLDLRGEKS